MILFGNFFSHTESAVSIYQLVKGKCIFRTVISKLLHKYNVFRDLEREAFKKINNAIYIIFPCIFIFVSQSMCNENEGPIWISLAVVSHLLSLQLLLRLQSNFICHMRISFIIFIAYSLACNILGSLGCTLLLRILLGINMYRQELNRNERMRLLEF